MTFPNPWFVILTLAVAASFVWTAVFFPANMSTDSIVMLQQALGSPLDDWHPVGLTLLERAFHQLLSPHVSLQTTVAVAAFTQGTLFWAVLLGTANASIPQGKPRWWAGLILAYYPLWLYTATLWKDVWFAIFFIPVPLLVYRAIESRRLSLGRLVLLVLLGLGAQLGRHSAAFAYFAAVALIALLLRLRGRLAVRVLIGLTLAAIIASSMKEAVHRRFDVAEVDLGNLVLLYDLVGTLYHSKQPEGAFENLETYRHFPGALESAVRMYPRYVEADYLYWGSSAPFPPDRFFSAGAEVHWDLALAAFRFPRAYLAHKARLLLLLTGISGVSHPYHAAIDENDLGLVQTSYVPSVRRIVVDQFLDRIYLSTWSRDRSRNPIWLALQAPFRHYLMALASLTLALLVLQKEGGEVPGHDVPMVLFLGGLAVFAPMVVVLPVADWRYLMPANALWALSVISATAHLLPRKSRETGQDV